MPCPYVLLMEEATLACDPVPLLFGNRLIAQDVILVIGETIASSQRVAGRGKPGLVTGDY